MQNNTTELVFILDRSGSMSPLVSDTIGGFNSLIEKQKKVDGKCYVTTILFDHQIQVLHDRIELARIQPMTDEDYSVCGSTALLDAIGFTSRHIVEIHRSLRPEDVPENTTFVIMTDGMENASRLFSVAAVRRMIEHEKEKYGWEFLFLAANIDAVKTAEHMGIRADRAVDYMADRQGTKLSYDVLSETIGRTRQGHRITDDWNRRIRDDYNSRGGWENR